MDRHKSFSLKPTSFSVFSFAITFSLLCLAFFSISVINPNLSFSRDTFNQPSLNLGLTTAHNLSTFPSNFTNEILVGTHLGGQPLNASLAASREPNYLAKVLVDALNRGDCVNCNSSRFSAIKSRTEVNYSDPDTTQFKKPEIASGLAGDSVFRWRPRNENESQVEVQANTVIQKFDTSSVLEKSSGFQEKSDGRCDLSKGKWVYDESYPLYTNVSCPFIDEGFNCEANGRSDRDYMKWRWQPQDCDFPRFNATKMLEMTRGKRLVFVGDSINRNQWESMMCLLMKGIKDPKRVYEARGRRITKEKGNYCFKFLDYKCTVEYYVTHFLVHESKARIGKKRVQTLKIDTMDRGSSRWKGADVLVFNTAHWWSHFKTRSGINYYQEGDLVHPRLDVSTAFRKALLTWSSWVDRHINPVKTQVFFRTSSPSHFRGGDWNSGGQCRGVSRPISRIGNSNDAERNIIVEEVIHQMKSEVKLLNISRMSDYRVDGHPSIYGRRPPGGQDCSHWCLPGVPDTWNQLLFFHLQSP